MCQELAWVSQKITRLSLTHLAIFTTKSISAVPQSHSTLNHSTIVIVIVIGLEGVDFDEEEVVDKVIWTNFFSSGGGSAQ